MGNLGQKQRELGVNVRLNMGSCEVEPSEINRAIESGQN